MREWRLKIQELLRSHSVSEVDMLKLKPRSEVSLWLYLLHSALCFRHQTHTLCQVPWGHQNGIKYMTFKEIIMQIREGLLQKSAKDHFKYCLTAE